MVRNLFFKTNGVLIKPQIECSRIKLYLELF